MLSPKYCCLIDTGTIPQPESLTKFFVMMEGDKNIGGVCGYMGLKVESIIDGKSKQRKDLRYYNQYDIITQALLKLFNIQKCQRFEYSISHILDKSFESSFGFIQVLPGAFSAYRWNALKEIPGETNILNEEYLKSIIDKSWKPSMEEANMMLAEDRILCLEIFCRKKYILRYCPDAESKTDCINSLIDLMGQRKRWINGSWFALMHVLKMFEQRFSQSDHGNFRYCILMFQIFWILINTGLSYFGISFYFIFLFQTSINTFKDWYIHAIGPLCGFITIILTVYAILVFGLIFFSLQLKNNKKVLMFQFISTILGIFVLCTYGFYGYLIIRVISGNYYNIANTYSGELVKKSITPLIVLNLGGFAIPSVFYVIFFNTEIVFRDLLICVKDYIFYSPAYIHTLLIYAFCNVNDLSWGTKGQMTVQSQDPYQDEKVNFVGVFIFCNVLLSVIMVVFFYEESTRNWALLIFGYVLTLNVLIKAVFSIYWSISYKLQFIKFEKKVKGNKTKYQEQNNNAVNIIQEKNEQMTKTIKQDYIKSINNMSQFRPMSYSRINLLQLPGGAKHEKQYMFDGVNRATSEAAVIQEESIKLKNQIQNYKNQNQQQQN